MDAFRVADEKRFIRKLFATNKAAFERYAGIVTSKSRSYDGDGMRVAHKKIVKFIESLKSGVPSE